jgi:hypothetical protein
MIMSKYTAQIGGHSWSQGPKAEFRTITECRRWAESYGTTADWCEITDSQGRPVGIHTRVGTKWTRAYVPIGEIMPEDEWVSRETERACREQEHDTMEEKRDHHAPLDKLVDEYK